MYLSNQSLLVIIVVGIVAGWLAGRVMEGGFGLIGDLIVGLIGAFIGDWLLPRLHLGVGIVALIINAFIGAVVLLLILRLVGGRWGRRRWGALVEAVSPLWHCYQMCPRWEIPLFMASTSVVIVRSLPCSEPVGPAINDHSHSSLLSHRGGDENW